MSTETKTICNIRYVTDCDTELYSCGEVDGAFDQEDLDNYLKTYGEEGKIKLINHLAFLQFQVIKTCKELKFNDDWSEDCQKYYGVNS